MDNRFLFLGGDRRSIYAARAIMRRCSVSAVGLGDFPQPTGRYGAVVLPLPFMKNGSINAPLTETDLPLSMIAQYAADGATVFSGGSSAALEELCRLNGLRLVDYFAEEPLTLKNAALTAEAAVALLIQHTDFSLHSADIVITGGGRISLMTARLLKAFGSNICVCARSPEQRMKAALEYHSTAELAALPKLCENADIIINTVPSPLFTEEHFRKMQPAALFMELAGSPDCPEKQYAKKYGVQYIAASGLPGKYSPKTAGEAIAEVILAKT